MSWLTGIKEMRLYGFKSIEINVPKEDLQFDGVFFPFWIDYASAIEQALGIKVSDLIGNGNAQLIDNQVFDFIWESYVWPNFWTSYDDALLTAEQDLSVVLAFAALKITTVNEFTDVESKHDVIKIFFIPPNNTADDINLNYSLCGYFSPPQDLILSVFNEDLKSTPLHETIHAITRSATELLKDIMYGGSESEQKEEIMTHLVTDKFASFKVIQETYEDQLKVDYKTEDGWEIPVGLKLENLKDLQVSNPNESRFHSVLQVEKTKRTSLNKLRLGNFSSKTPSRRPVKRKTISKLRSLLDKGSKSSLKAEVENILIERNNLNKVSNKFNLDTTSLKRR